MENGIILGRHRLKLVEHRDFEADSRNICTKAGRKDKEAFGELLAAIDDGSTWRAAHLSAIARRQPTIHFHHRGRAALGAAIEKRRFILLGIAICRDNTDLDRFRAVCSQRMNEILKDEE